MKFSKEISYKKIFLLLCVLQLLLWTLIPFLTHGVVKHDVAEGIAWGYQFQFGYSKMPPFTAWLCALVSQSFLGGVGFPVYLLAQLVVITSYYYTWQLGKIMADEKVALLSVLLLMGVIYYNINTSNITPDTMSTPIWVAIAYYAYICFFNKKSTLYAWLLLGIFSGLGILTKYSVLFLFISLLVAIFCDKIARRKMLSIYPYLAVVIVIVIISPHIVWLIQHDFVSVRYVKNSAIAGADNPIRVFHLQSLLGRHVSATLDYLLSQLPIIVAIFILAWPIYLAKPAPQKRVISDIKYLSFMAWGPFVILLLYSFFSGNHVIPRWTTPFFSMSGLWLILILNKVWDKSVVVQVMLFSFTVFFLVAIGQLGYNLYRIFNHANSDVFFNAPLVVDKINQLWRQKTNTNNKLRYIAGNHYLVAYLSIYDKYHPAPLMDLSIKQSPWIDMNRFKQYGAMIAIDEKKPQLMHTMAILAKQKNNQLIDLGNYFFPAKYPCFNDSNRGTGKYINLYFLSPRKKSTVVMTQ